VQETECPKCGEWLGVPPEFADRAVKCGSCGRVIQPHERADAPPRSPTPRYPNDDRPTSRSPRFPDRPERDDDAPPRRKGGLVWLWLLLGFGGLSLCCCGGLVAVGLTNANKWERYTAENGAFTAEFPGKPVHEEKDFQWNDKNDTRGKAHEYAAVQWLNTQGFAIHYADLPKSMKAIRPTDKKLLSLGLNDLKTKSPEFTVLSAVDRKVAAYDAMDVEGTYTDPQQGFLHAYVRVMIVGDRVFTLMAAGKDKKKLNRDKERFFNSFQPADPNDASKEKVKEKGKDKDLNPKEE
jgi:hypothetical protein